MPNGTCTVFEFWLVVIVAYVWPWLGEALLLCYSGFVLFVAVRVSVCVSLCMPWFCPFTLVVANLGVCP